MEISKSALKIIFFLCFACISCGQLKNPPNKNLPYKISITGTEGLKFDGYYQTFKKDSGESQDSVHINGVIPAEYYVNDSYYITCSIGSQDKGSIRLLISNKETGDIAADSSNGLTGSIYVTTIERNGKRFSGPGIKNYPPTFFLNIEAKDTIPHHVVLFKEWDAGVNLSTTLTEKCPFTIPLPDCDVIAASFMTTTDMKEFYVTLTDVNNKILKRDSSDGKEYLDFEFRTKPRDDK